MLTDKIKLWAYEIGFAHIGITDTNLTQYAPHLTKWLNCNYQADMSFMQQHVSKRIQPTTLLPNTKSIICVALQYKDICNTTSSALQSSPYIAQYAQRCDYHKIIRKKLQQLADKITTEIGAFNYRAFCDSAPVLEKALAAKAGLGWVGKNSCLLNKKFGSQFFLGELYTDLALNFDATIQNSCGNCKKCITKCPTGALTAPYILDANRCIAYLTIEHKHAIPITLRPLIGKRIFGCEVCQTVCPWNQTQLTINGNSITELIKFFNWNETEFWQQTKGTVIRRLGHMRWLRNIAVALGNILSELQNNPEQETIRQKINQALHKRLSHPNTIVREHVEWAINRK